MAVPKRKTSKARKRKRRSHLALKAPTLVRCKRCEAWTPAHTICGECGFYRGKPVLQMDEGV